MRRPVQRGLLRAALVGGALLFGSVAGVAAAQPEGSSNLAQEGFPGEPKKSEVCTATSSDHDCLDYWEEHINWWSLDYKRSPDQRPEHRHMPAPFGFALINFAVFLGILWRLAGRPLTEYVRARHVGIKKDLDEAAVMRRAAETKLVEYETKIAGMDREIDELVASIRKDAEAEKARMVAAAEGEAVRLQKDAEAQIKNEIDRVRRELRREVVDLALATAETMLREKAGPDDQKKLVDRYLAGLDGAAPGPAKGSLPS